MRSSRAATAGSCRSTRSNTLEIGGIHVDVGGADAQTARLRGLAHGPAPRLQPALGQDAQCAGQSGANLPDGTLDQIVSSINVEREQIGPNRYIADLGVQFDRDRAAPFLGVEGAQVAALGADAPDSGDRLRRARRPASSCATPGSARGRSSAPSQSPIDYVRVSGMGADPLLVNAAQTARPGRGWWRNLLDMYGAQDILVAEVQLQRLYPGGPARGRFIARHGPDNEIVGGFTLTAANSDGDSGDDGARGRSGSTRSSLRPWRPGGLTRDSSLDLPPPPVIRQLPVKRQCGPSQYASIPFRCRSPART